MSQRFVSALSRSLEAHVCRCTVMAGEECWLLTSQLSRLGRALELERGVFSLMAKGSSHFSLTCLALGT